MKKVNGNALTILFLFICFVSFAQYKRTEKIDRATYQDLKKKGKLERGVRYEFDKNTNTPYRFQYVPSHNEIMSGSCGSLPPVTYTTVVFDNFFGTDSLVDDASTTEIMLPFTFCFYGTNYNSCYINSNGNITFGTNQISFSSTGFPNNSDVMIAPFWADFDNSGGDGIVQYSIGNMGGNYLIVRWNQMGYFPASGDKLNTCSLIITDGLSTILPAGNNVGFFYGDMNWTTGSASGGTNGFGGTAATVGMNKGDGTNFIQIGRFDTSGTQFISNTALNNGVDWLDNKSFFFNLCSNGNNIAPVSINYSGCDTVKACGFSDTLLLENYFASPEVDQITSVTVSAPTLGANMTTYLYTPGSSTHIINQIITNPGLAGYHDITYTATDNGTPAQTTIVTVTLFISNPGMVDPVITANPTGICPGDTTTLTLNNCASFVNHVWSNGDIGCSTNISAQGSQYVTVEDANGCAQTKFIDVNLIPAPIPVVLGSMTYCGGQNGSPLQLAPATPAEPAYASIVWNPGSTVGSNFTATAGTYTVTVTGINGCVTDTVFTVSDLGPPAFTVRNDTCMSTTATIPLDVNFSCISNVSCALTTACPEGSPQNYVVGTGSAPDNSSFDWPTPYGNYYRNSRHQFLVLASELTAMGVQAGNINSIAFNVTALNGIDALPNYTIKMMCTNLTSLPTAIGSDNFIPGTIQVYSNPSYVVTLGQNLHAFTQPYAWDGVSNLIIETCFDQTNPSFSNNASVTQSNTPFTSTINAFSDGDPVCTSPINVLNFVSFNDFMVRPDITFNVVPSVNPANYTYQWAPVTGLSNPNIKNPTVTAPIGSTTYTVTVTTLNGQCSRTDSVRITVGGYAQIVTTDSVFCNSDPVQQFTLSPSTPTGGSWAHHVNGSGNGGGVVPAGNTADFHPELSVLGNSYVVYTVGPANCAIQDSVEVLVSQKIPATFTTIGPFCEYDSPTVLSTIANNAGGTWTINGSSATQFNPATLGPSTPPGYKLQYKTDLGVGCPDSVIKFVEVFIKPNADFTADTLIGCLPSVPIVFTSTVTTVATANSYNWNFGDASTSNIASPVHVYTQAGLHTVTLTFTDVNGCIDTETKSQYITINSIPEPDFVFEPNNPTALEPHVDFFNTTPNSSGLIWNWNVANMDSATFFNISYDFPRDGQYDVTLTATTVNGCVASITHPVIVRPDYAIYVPNAFSPNGDGKNDVFIPKTNGVQVDDYTMSIYDRWGEKVFETNDLNIGWKGSKNNSDNIVTESGTYIYKIIYKDAFLKGHTTTGHITVVR